jgi:hypothetical protein
MASLNRIPSAVDISDRLYYNHFSHSRRHRTRFLGQAHRSGNILRTLQPLICQICGCFFIESIGG